MLKEKFDLTGKIALVTGSTRGIGKAIGDAFEEYAGLALLLEYRFGAGRANLSKELP